jgi:hypothetical protein
MNKKLLPAILLVVLCLAVFSSCKKSSSYQGNYDLLYFPLQLGHYVTYNVDSTYYNSAVCTTVLRTSQAKYIVSDTFRDVSGRLSYIIDVQYRATANDNWVKQSVALVTQTDTSLTYGQAGLYSTKMVYPIQAGTKWYPYTSLPSGDSSLAIPSADSSLQYLLSWTSSYQSAGFKQPYNTGTIYFDNTVTVMEDDELINNTIPDSTSFNYRSYAKEVYAQNVGMVYREYTNETYNPYVSECVQGVSVTMSAIDHN